MSTSVERSIEIGNVGACAFNKSMGKRGEEETFRPSSLSYETVTARLGQLLQS